MARERDLAELVAREPDPRLLDEDPDGPDGPDGPGGLAAELGRPPAPVSGAARARIVALGVTLTGVTLVVGLVLLIVAAVVLFSGGSVGSSLVALVPGVALVGTHWGWVHVAEAGGQALDARRNREVIAGRRRWLEAIEPYTRWSVLTRADPDGSITIVTERHVPVAVGERRFSFVREIADEETLSGDEPAAAVAERAELLRRRAAAATAEERERYATVSGALQRAMLSHADEQERVAVVRAASEALSDQINTKLRDPPLTE